MAMDDLTPEDNLTPGDNHVASVTIRAFGSDGEGVGDLPDGRVVFVPRTAPGDQVSLRLTQQKKRWARGQLVEVLQAAPTRAEPVCPYYADCGGCTLQHVSYEEQLAWKGRFVEAALKRIGGLEVTVPPVVPSPDRHNYRSRVTFTLLRIPGERVVAGFHHLLHPKRIVDVQDGCVLPDPALATAWRQLRAAWGDAARRLPGGKRLRLTLRSVDEGVILVVDGGKGPGRPDVLMKEVEGLVAVWGVDSRGVPHLLGGQALVHETRLGETTRTTPKAFLQVNVGAAEKLQAWVIEAARVEPGTRVVDAYCGVGSYGRRIARAGGQAVGIEQNTRAAKAASRDAPQGFTVLTGMVEERLNEALPADLVILNPPRAGVDSQVIDILQARHPARLIYVSCDPATLARDLGRLSAEYDVSEIRAFDLFPQTSHVETVVLLARRDAEKAS
jgi:23S rRNA (uracil1939-C5)-methyltransferase